MNLEPLQTAVRNQIARAIENGFRRFNMYDLENQYFSCELNGNHINIILVEKHGYQYETDVCSLSDLYFSHQCEFLRFVLGEERYLEIAKNILARDDTQRILEVDRYMRNGKVESENKS